MSNNYWDDEDDDLDTEIETQPDGSDLLKKLRKAKRSDEKRIKELTEQLENYTKEQRERTVKEVLEKKGVNLKAARLIMKDIEDFSEESVNNWLEENSDLFGLTPAEEARKTNEFDRAELRRQDSLTQNAVSPDRAEDLDYKLGAAQSADDILSILRSQS